MRTRSARLTRYWKAADIGAPAARRFASMEVMHAVLHLDVVFVVSVY